MYHLAERENRELVTVFNADLFRRWIEWLDVKPTTRRSYENGIKQFGFYLQDKGITGPTREDVVAFRDYLLETRTPGTVAAYLAAVRLFFQWTEAEGLYKNIAARVKSPKVSKMHKRDPFNAEQVKEMGSTEHLRNRAIILLLAVCGLRTVEVVRANIEDLRNGKLYIQGKGRVEKDAFARIPNELNKVLFAYLNTRPEAKPTDPLFISESNFTHGQRMSTRSVSWIVKENARACGIDSPRLTAHSLRHFAVTEAIKAGLPILEVKEFSRHASVETLNIYAHAEKLEQNQCEAVISSKIF